MTKHFLFFVCVCCMIFSFFASNVSVFYNAPIDIIRHRVIALMYCESDGNANAIHYNDGGMGRDSVGYLQFQQRTFDYLGEKYNLPHTDIHNMREQYDIGYEAVKRGEFSHWVVCAGKLNFSTPYN